MTRDVHCLNAVQPQNSLSSFIISHVTNGGTLAQNKGEKRI